VLPKLIQFPNKGLADRKKNMQYHSLVRHLVIIKHKTCKPVSQPNGRGKIPINRQGYGVLLYYNGSFKTDWQQVWCPLQANWLQVHELYAHQTTWTYILPGTTNLQIRAKSVLISDETSRSNAKKYIANQQQQKHASLGPPVKEILAPVDLLLELKNTVQ
jgi:hypothetical protein